MSSTSHEIDERPWDQRLLERISRSSSHANPDSSLSLYLGAFHGVVAGIAAAIGGSGFMVAVVAGSLGLGLSMHVRARLRRSRAQRSPSPRTPNPFGH